MRYAIILAAMLLPLPAHAADDPPEPASHPDWSDVGREGVQIIRNSLYDPESVTIEWVSGFKWGYRKPVIGKRKFGWVACGNFNAKNRLGGYTGNQGFVLLHTPDGKTAIYEYGDGTSTCGRGVAPVNPELLALIAKEDARISVADELTKLAALLERGLITQAEYDTQKAKLLAN